MKNATLIPLPDYRRYPPEEMLERSKEFFLDMRRRRTVRDFSSESIPFEIIEHCLRVAGMAPSGANLQPWHFVVITGTELKKQIRIAAEKEEEQFYKERAPKEWLDALAPLGTDWKKPFLEIAPYLIAIFSQPYGLLPDGRKIKHYYALESVGLATGMLIAALHRSGLAILTHTPSPMNFLGEILERPSNERPFLLLAVGYPAEGARVPDIKKKDLAEIATFR